MATLTLGQMLYAALGSSRAGAIDFEQLHNLLNGMLLHLGLKDLSVQASGEPLEGAEGSPFSASFLEELKKKVEANEKEIAEVRALCQVLHEEVNEMKVEQSRMEEIVQNFGTENILEDLRNQLLDTVMSSMKDVIQGEQDFQDSPDGQSVAASRLARRWEDQGLIVIGNEITLLERPRTPVTRHGDSRPVTPLSPMGRDRNSLEGNVSTEPVSPGANDVGQKDTRQIKDEEISKAKALPGHSYVPPEMTNVREIKAEESKISISKVEDGSPEMTSTGEMEDGEIKSISKKKSLGVSFTDPGSPGTHLPGQRVQSVQGHSGSKTLCTFAESMAEIMAGSSSRLPTARAAHRGGGSYRMEPLPDEAGLKLLMVPSCEYAPCEQLVKMAGQYSEIIPSTAPPSPGLSGRLPHGLKRPQAQEQREQAAEGYSRRSPMYCGGKHTSISPVQLMEPLLPDPNKPGVFDLVGKDGLVYRGRTP